MVRVLGIFMYDVHGFLYISERGACISYLALYIFFHCIN